MVLGRLATISKSNKVYMLGVQQAACFFTTSIGVSLVIRRVRPSITQTWFGLRALRMFSTNESTPPKKSKLYTRTGDKGESSLYNLKRRPKSDPTFDALGHTDELSAVIGIARVYSQKSSLDIDDMLADIQSRLQEAGAAIATPLDSSTEQQLSFAQFNPEHILKLEKQIDILDSQCPKLTVFILPSGGEAAVHLHLARTVSRRAERAVVPLVQAGHVPTAVGKYYNRLSDFFFAAARYAAHKTGHADEPKRP